VSGDSARGSGTTVEQLAAAADAAAENAAGWYDISPYLKMHLSSDDINGWLLSAFDYSSKRPADAHGGTTAFGSQFQDSQGVYPWPVSEVPDAALELWEGCAMLAKTPAVRARLNHLCFERRWGNAADHLRRGAKAYLQVGGDEGWQRLDRADALWWALELARKMGDDTLIPPAVEALVDLAEVSMGQDKPEPGVALRAVEAVMSHNQTEPRLAGLLDRARVTYPDAFMTERTIALQRRLVKGDHGRRAALDREEVEAWMVEAERAGGPVKMMHLEKVIGLARDRGFTDLVQAATTELQQLGLDDLGLVRFSSSVKIPAAEVEAYLSQFTEADSLSVALALLLSAGPPSGTMEQNMASVRDEAGQVSSLFRRVRVTQDGLPSWRPTNPNEEEDEQLARQEAFQLQVKGGLTAETLSRILAKFRPTEDELVDLLTNPPHCTTKVARSISRALGHYFQDDFEAASCVITPKIEGLARRIALAGGPALYRPQRGETPGQYPGLGSLLTSLRASGLDPSWHRFLWTFLASPAGPNYRNELSHGLIDTYDRVSAALLLLAALYLATLGHRSEQQGSDD
jgi:hypothetical protein